MQMGLSGATEPGAGPADRQAGARNSAQAGDAPGRATNPTTKRASLDMTTTLPTTPMVAGAAHMARLAPRPVAPRPGVGK